MHLKDVLCHLLCAWGDLNLVLSWILLTIVQPFRGRWSKEKCYLPKGSFLCGELDKWCGSGPKCNAIRQQNNHLFDHMMSYELESSFEIRVYEDVYLFLLASQGARGCPRSAICFKIMTWYMWGFCLVELQFFQLCGFFSPSVCLFSSHASVLCKHMPNKHAYIWAQHRKQLDQSRRKIWCDRRLVRQRRQNASQNTLLCRQFVLCRSIDRLFHGRRSALWVPLRQIL